jgi:hypothetical protein
MPRTVVNPQLEHGTGLAPNAKDPELAELPRWPVPQSNLQNDQPPARNGESSNKPKFEKGRTTGNGYKLPEPTRELVPQGNPAKRRPHRNSENQTPENCEPELSYQNVHEYRASGTGETACAR